MKLIVGLGNTEEKYRNTRHNAGFILLDNWANALNINWALEKKFNASIAKDSSIIFAKPTTSMNNSGTAVVALVNFFNIDLLNLLVVHDDVDLEFSKNKLNFASGSAGHHGVEDIFAKLKSKDFWRFRIGVGRPSSNSYDVHNYVLSEYDSNQLKLLQDIKLPAF